MFLEYKDLPLCQFSQIFLNLNNCLVLSHQSAALIDYCVRINVLPARLFSGDIQS